MTGYDFWKNVDAKMKLPSLKELAKTYNLDYVRIVNQRSDCRIPKLEDAFSLSKALGVSIEYLLTGEEINISPYPPRIDKIARHLMKIPSRDLDTIESMVFAVQYDLNTEQTVKKYS